MRNRIYHRDCYSCARFQEIILWLLGLLLFLLIASSCHNRPVEHFYNSSAANEGFHGRKVHSGNSTVLL